MTTTNELPKVDQPKTKRNKRERIPVNGNSRNLLTVQGLDHSRYKYRWIIADPERVAKFDDAWYTPVKADEIGGVGDRKVDTSAGPSSVVTTRAGGGKTYILVKIEKELWEQDQAEKHRKVDESEAEMKREATKDRYGKLEIDRSGRSDAPVGS